MANDTIASVDIPAGAFKADEPVVVSWELMTPEVSGMPVEIVVTDRMKVAGVDALREQIADLLSDTEYLVESIFRAMAYQARDERKLKQSTVTQESQQSGEK